MLVNFNKIVFHKGSSREARSLAENAFFHPSIMSVSYFSYEHCFAVYSVSFVVSTSVINLSPLLSSTRFSKSHVFILSWTAVFPACCWTRYPCSTTRMEKIQTREGQVLDMANQKEVGLGPCGHFEHQSNPLAYSQILCNF